MTTAVLSRSLHSVADVTAMIEAGDILLLAGEERLLAALPRGRWIGGTIPYFMTAEQGGVCDRDRIFVTRLPDTARIHSQAFYDADALPGFAVDGPDNGFTVVLLPSQSQVHSDFATHGAGWMGLFNRPVVGWVAGVFLDRVGIDTPKVFDGGSGRMSSELAAIMHVALSGDAFATVDIVNLFDQGDGDTLTFDETGFSARSVRVNGGDPVGLIDYIADNAIDTRLPLVADYNGAHINVATARIVEETGSVEFFAPVFPGIAYRFARPVVDYPAIFEDAVANLDHAPAFSCNCILNYVYAGLEGQRTASITGPMTFGEIAYVLLTQTLVHLTIRTVDEG